MYARESLVHDGDHDHPRKKRHGSNGLHSKRDAQSVGQDARKQRTNGVSPIPPQALDPYG
jgi:hypothetical protein